MSLDISIDEMKERLGSCYGCETWSLVNERVRCDKGKSMSEMKKEGSPCLEEITGVLNTYNTKDEFDNVETKYY